jgi:hypothetical protein
VGAAVQGVVMQQAAGCLDAAAGSAVSAGGERAGEALLWWVGGVWITWVVVGGGALRVCVCLCVQ